MIGRIAGRVEYKGEDHVLIDVQGLSYEEAAEATGASVGTIKSRLSRARARVRDLLLEHRELLPARFRQTQ